MSKQTRFIVLGAGVITLIGFALPIVAVKDSLAQGLLSGFGLLGVPGANILMYMILLPMLVVTLFGILGAIKGRFGRGFAVPTMILGLISFLLAYLVYSAGKEVAAQTGAGAVGSGMYIVLLGTAAAFIGGLAGTIKPYRGAQTPAFQQPGVDQQRFAA